jgi:hypothetical protein
MRTLAVLGEQFREPHDAWVAVTPGADPSPALS